MSVIIKVQKMILNPFEGWNSLTVYNNSNVDTKLVMLYVTTVNSSVTEYIMLGGWRLVRAFAVYYYVIT